MTKLCPRGKAAAKRKFKIYPSAYANAYASKICAGKIKDPSGVKRKDFKGPKPMSKGGGADTGTVGEIRSKQGVIFNKVKRMVRDDKDLSPKRRKRILQQVKAKSEERMNRKNIEAGIEFSKEFQRGRRELFKSTAGKKIPAFKVGMAVTAGAQSGMGRLQKSGLMKAKKGKAIAIMIAVGKPKKANDGEFIERPMPKMRRIKSNNPTRYGAEYLKKKQAYDYLSQDGTRKVSVDRPIERKKRKSGLNRPDYEYIKKQKAYDILTDQDRPKRPSRPIKKSKGGDATIKKVIKGLHKASALHKGQAKSLQTVVKKASKGKIIQVANKLEKASKAHAGQAKTLRSIKVRGGGMALQGMNFKGVY